MTLRILGRYTGDLPQSVMSDCSVGLDNLASGIARTLWTDTDPHSYAVHARVVTD